MTRMKRFLLHFIKNLALFILSKQKRAVCRQFGILLLLKYETIITRHIKISPVKALADRILDQATGFRSTGGAPGACNSGSVHRIWQAIPIQWLIFYKNLQANCSGT